MGIGAAGGTDGHFCERGARMFTCEDHRMNALHPPFRMLREMMDSAIGRIGKFQPNHRSDIHKAVVKSLSIEDAGVVEMTLRLAQDRYPEADIQVYPMLHLAGDTNECGRWHRDGAEKTGACSRFR